MYEYAVRLSWPQNEATLSYWFKRSLDWKSLGTWPLCIFPIAKDGLFRMLVEHSRSGHEPRDITWHCRKGFRKWRKYKLWCGTSALLTLRPWCFNVFSVVDKGNKVEGVKAAVHFSHCEGWSLSTVCWWNTYQYLRGVEQTQASALCVLGAKSRSSWTKIAKYRV